MLRERRVERKGERRWTVRLNGMPCPGPGARAMFQLNTGLLPVPDVVVGAEGDLFAVRQKYLFAALVTFF